MAETQPAADRAFDLFLATFAAKFPAATTCLAKDRDVLLTFYAFPAEHWIHIRTTNPVESTFATVRLRDVPPILSSTSVESPIIRKGRSDVKKRFTEAQIIGFLREAEAGLPVKDLCRRHGFSEASYYLWRSKFGGMTVSDAKRLKELETENGRLKKLLAESQLEIEVTREVLQKKW